MSLRDVPIDEIEAQHLHEQIENSVPESQTVDYKAQMPGTTEADKKEFLKDVCAFANSSGGDLVFGISEDDEAGGVPASLNGVTVDNNPDAEILRLDNLIRDGLEPRLAGVSIRPVDVGGERYGFVIRIPRSFNRPHAVNYKRHWRFYSRGSAGNHAMDVSQVRDAFVFSESLATRMRDFRTQRLADLKSGESPVSMEGEATTALHVMPLSAFDSPSQNLDLTPALNRRRIQPMQMGGQARRNFDGVLSASHMVRDEGPSPKSYALIFRSGIIEAADSQLLWPDYSERDRTDRIIPILMFERALLETLEEYMKLLSALDIEGPIFVALSLLDVGGYVIPRDGVTTRASQPIDRADLVIPEIMAESPHMGRDGIGQLIKPIYDSIWNACGLAGSPYYDDGYWRGRG